MHCILYGSFLHFTRAMVRTSRTTMLTILQCFVLIVFVFGEKTENFEVNEVEVNKEKPEVSPPKAVVSSALMQASKVAVVSPSFSSRKGLSGVESPHLWEESESLLIEEFMEHMEPVEHSDRRMPQAQEIDEVDEVDIDKIDNFPNLQPGWSGCLLVLRSLLLAMVLHLTCLVYSQCRSKKFMVSPVGMDEVDTNLGNGDDEATDTWGCSALHVAAADANLEEMRRVLPHTAADVNAVDAWDETPLHMAVRRGSIAACDLLLEAKADVNARNANDETPLAVINAKANSENDLAQNSDFDLVALSHLLFSHGAVLGNSTHTIPDAALPRPCATALLESLLENSRGEDSQR